ncbi:MAG: dihydroorotate dehydrogenase [Thermoleophilia bacterium]|nr:dihydroorotate dehydrogenase [Thermoleophilia bacterium]
MTSLAVDLAGLKLDHPLINGSGTMDLFSLADSLGPTVLEHPPVSAYVPKTVTLRPRLGNPTPRVVETASGIVNSVGLPNPGLETFISRELPELLRLPCPVIISVGGESAEEYEEIAHRLAQALGELADSDWVSRVALELNISCPNVARGGAAVGSDPVETSRVVAACRRVWAGVLIAKLTPNVTDISVIGKAAVGAGADAICAVNTYKALVLDRYSLRPYLGSVTGGLSGPAIKPLALRAVYDLYKAVQVPIIGMGGIVSVQDVLEFISCGATAVGLGSALLREPCLPRVLAQELAQFLDERQLTLEQLRGFAHREANELS